LYMEVSLYLSETDHRTAKLNTAERMPCNEPKPLAFSMTIPHARNLAAAWLAEVGVPLSA
jgi:hypothetical protein